MQIAGASMFDISTFLTSFVIAENPSSIFQGIWYVFGIGYLVLGILTSIL